MTDAGSPPLRATPAPRRRRRLWGILGPALALLVAGLAWGSWQLWQLGQPLLALRDVAGQAQAHLRAGDVTALSADLDGARALATTADAAAHAPAVALAARLPWIGDDVTVARELARAAAELGDGSAAVGPLLARLSGGGLDPLAEPGTREAIAQVRTAAAAASARLAGLDLDGLVLPVGDDVARLRDGLGRVGPAVDVLLPNLDALAVFLAAGERHTWFVAMQNLGESRPSGGMIGSWLLVRTDDGTLTVLQQGLNQELDTDRAVDYAATLPEGYRQVWGDSLDNWRSFTLSPHFPDNARMLAQTWNARGEERADGVLALGQGTVRLLAAATGPVTVAGRTIAPSDLADYLMVGVYQDYPDPVEKDAAVSEVIAQVLGRLSAGRFDLPGVLAAALQGPGADYLQLWSSEPDLQERIEAAGVSGSFPDEPGPVTTVRLANAAANKLDAFVHLGAEYRLGECTVDEDGVATRDGTLTVTLRNAVPDGLPDYVTGRGELIDGRSHPTGSTRDFVVVHTPVQATLTGALLDGQQALVQSAWVDGRQMLVFDVALEPGATSTVTVSWDEFTHGADDRPFPLTGRIVLPPLANPATTTVIPGGACK